MHEKSLVQRADDQPVDKPVGSPPPSEAPAAPREVRTDLSPRYVSAFEWLADAHPLTDSALSERPLFKLWQTIPGGHKWSHYFEIYESVFSSYVGKPLRMLEIGVYRGSSLKMWRKYFSHPDTVIVGIDIDPSCARYHDPSANVHVRIGSQTDVEFLQQIVAEHGPFDIILDDGSHVSSHMVTSFNQLFGDALKADGVYMVEDLHANYWPGYRDSERSFIDLCKQIIEIKHSHYQLINSADAYRHGSTTQAASVVVPWLTAQVLEVRFFDSIVAIYKKPAGHIPSILWMEE